MPDHWQHTTIGDVAEFVGERTDPALVAEAAYVGLEHLVSGQRSLSLWGSTSQVSSSTTPFRPGDTLFGRLRPYLKKGCVAPFSGVCTPEILVLRPRSGVSQRFLALLVLNDRVFDECDRLGAGSRMPRVSARDLGALGITVPPPPEQKRIVDVIGSIDSYISAVEEQLGVTRAARAALLADLLSHPGDDWQETTIDRIATLVGGYAFPRKEQGGREGLPFIKVSDMNSAGNEKEIRHSENYVTLDQCQRMRLRPRPEGTVVFPKVGAALMTEKRRLLAQPTLFDNNIMGLVATDAVRAEFLYYWMCKVKLGDFAQEGAVPSVNNGIVGSLPIWVPPIPEQRRIVELIESFDVQVEALEGQLVAARGLRAGVLSELLSGERLLDESYDVAVGL